MASCGYHSPQFSEDIAWLPAWLQPHQLPAIGGGDKNDNAFSQLSCKSLGQLPKCISGGQHSHISNKSDAKFSDFHLYLSGDGNSVSGNLPCSSEGLHLHLHLSSLGTSNSLPSASQLKEKAQPSNHETDSLISQSKMEFEGPTSKSQTENKLRFSQKKIKGSQKNQKRLQGKISNADIDYAVELSIAASEAMVISDIVNSSLQSENLPASSVLEIAVRVEKARKDSSLDSMEVDDLQVNDQLSDLDEKIMTDAYDDVGISLTQIIDSSDELCDSINFTQSNVPSSLNTQVPESQFEIEVGAENGRLENDVVVQKCAAVSMLEKTPLQPSSSIPLDRVKSCLKHQKKDDAYNFQQSTDSLIPFQVEPRETQNILKAVKVTSISNATTRKNTRAFKMESSFISESMEVEMIASSSTLHKNLSNESKRGTHDTCNTLDPLCSVVPCSISSECAEDSNEKNAVPDLPEMPLNSIAEGEPILYGKGNKIITSPNRRQFSSLRHHSTLDGDILLKSMGNCTDVDGSKGNSIDNVGPPIVLNNKKRRLRAYREISSNENENDDLENNLDPKVLKCKVANSIKENTKSKRVRFLEAKCSIEKTDRRNSGSRYKPNKRVKGSSLPSKYSCRKENCTCEHILGEKERIFQGLEFLLTGFSRQKEKELEVLIRLYGGYVLSSIPSNSRDLRQRRLEILAQIKLPVVISAKKVQTTKFLYGCAANTWILNARWLFDSIHASSLLSPVKYMTQPIQGFELNQLRIEEPFCLSNHTFIFERVGIMLNGKVSFCTKFSKIIKHGGGKVFKSLQRLVQSLKNETNKLGVVLIENESNVSRHLKHCALENSLQLVPANWIVNSLFSGKLLPLKKDRYAPLHRIKMPTFSLANDDNMSQEI